MSEQEGMNSTAMHKEVTTSSIDQLNLEIDAWLANNYSGVCPVRNILSRIGDKWSVLVVLRLGRKQQRFRELLRAVDGISQRMLTVTLRGLERDGLVHREVFSTRPPSVEYRLTELGFSLVDHISRIANWAVENQPRIEAARADYDGV